jgi:hypothetical protein
MREIEEKVIAQEKALLDWPFEYRLIIKSNIKQKKCWFCKNIQKVIRWGYIIDRYWIHWETCITWQKCETREIAIKKGMERFNKLLKKR